jgi:hypothetical protein
MQHRAQVPTVLQQDGLIDAVGAAQIPQRVRQKLNVTMMNRVGTAAPTRFRKYRSIGASLSIDRGVDKQVDPP